MLTEYGKFIRKCRIDADMSLRDMAKHLSVSPTFLSNVEIGNKKLPKRLISEIIKLFNMNTLMIDKLYHAIEQSTPHHLKINLTNYSMLDLAIIRTFLQNHNKISDDKKQQILSDIK